MESTADILYPSMTSAADTKQAEPVAATGSAASVLYPTMKSNADSEQADPAAQAEKSDPLSDARNGEPVTLSAIAQQDAETAAELGDFMRENRLPEAQAGKLAELHQKASDRASRKFWGNPEQWPQEVDGDPFISNNLPGARLLVRASPEGKEFAKFLAKARLDGHPTVLRFLARMASDRSHLHLYS